MYLNTFWDIKFKNLAVWLANSIFAFDSRTRFFPRFQQNHKGYYGAWLKSTKSTPQMTIFFAKSKKPYFWDVFMYYPQNEIFSQKSGSVSFLPLRNPNLMKSFMKSFRKILRVNLEKTRLPTDILTVVKSWDPFSPKGRGPIKLTAMP